jgi:glycyl-tRNA synthetase
MDQSFTFQSIIMNLERYWAEQGCLIWQPYYSQVGAGTMNPATFLRVLGPEPWNVGYVEPSVRPDDGRYGENPNRLQQHYQYQVILKPDPGDPQEKYLNSLVALGIDPAQHDIRFVEDNWTSPALGAWGLGWEVWLDGLEITQFTYFQQAGGLNLDPVSVELTYGLDRIAMALQKVDNFQHIQWDASRTAGDVNLQGEQEHSKYYFEIADIERLRKMYDLYEDEAESALENRLVLPAHDYILKCSHTFNILDTRGAIGVTERQALFSRMRDLARRTAELYVEERQRLEYPWLAEDETSSDEEKGLDQHEQKATQQPAVSEPADFLLEIGVEELPHADLNSAIAQLRTNTAKLLKAHRLENDGIQVWGTPRRLVVLVKSLTPRQPNLSSTVKGPPASRAFDPDGNPSKAALGFARSKGIQVDELETQEIDGGSYLVANVHEIGKSSLQILSEALPDLIAGLRFDKTMRWNASNVAFSRPIRWLLALFGSQLIPFMYAGIPSDRNTHLLRFSSPEQLAVETPSQYKKALADQGIILDPEERLKAIAAQVQELSRKVGGHGDVDEALLKEVNNLVESPTALLGEYEQSHLELPKEVLISVMKKHQRYFPVQDKNGALLPYFITIRNGGSQHLEVVKDGNEQVVRARFVDAAYFIKEDITKPLEAYIPLLTSLTFQKKLGSMLDKSRRVEALVQKILITVEANPEQRATALRAAQLCKADLATQMVVEMTSLQGIMGQFYAGRSGESAAVGEAIFEHYLPRYSGDSSPKTLPGLVVGIADRLDTLIGLFSANLAPTGTKDPFALRRSALGLAQNLIAWDMQIDLHSALAMASKNLPVDCPDEILAVCLEFIVGRLRQYLIDSGYRYDIVEAVLAEQKHNPARATAAIKQLSAWVARDDWSDILPAYSRCIRITRDQKDLPPIQMEYLTIAVEKELYKALLKAESVTEASGSLDETMTAFLPIIPLINQFFDEVLVMDDNEAIRANRLSLLQRIGDFLKGNADFSHLEGF